MKRILFIILALAIVANAQIGSGFKGRGGSGGGVTDADMRTAIGDTADVLRASIGDSTFWFADGDTIKPKPVFTWVAIESLKVTYQEVSYDTVKSQLAIDVPTSGTGNALAVYDSSVANTLVTAIGPDGKFTAPTIVANDSFNIESGYVTYSPDLHTLAITTADINGGAIDGVTIGAAAAGASTFTSITGVSERLTGAKSVTWTDWNGVQFDGEAATFTEGGTLGTRALGSAWYLGQPTFASSDNAVTITDASTFYVANAPAAGTNVTLTNPYAVYSATGNNYFGGNVGIGKKPTLALDVTGAIAASTSITAGTSIATGSTSYLTVGSYNLNYNLGLYNSAAAKIGSGNSGTNADGSDLFLRTNNADQLRLLNSTDRPILEADQGVLTIAETGTLGTECLTNGNFSATPADDNWAVAGGFAITGNKAVYTHSGGTGTLTQAVDSLAVVGVGSKVYKFAFTTSSVTGGCTVTITTAFCSSAVTLYAGTTPGNKSVYFQSSTAPTDFVISITSTAGAISFDDLSLKQVIDGDFRVSDDLVVDGSISVVDTSAVTAAATITLGTYNNFTITGDADIDSISVASTFPEGGVAYIRFDGTNGTTGVLDGKNLKLSGNFEYTPDDFLTLIRRGNYFYEISRSAN